MSYLEPGQMTGEPIDTSNEIDRVLDSLLDEGAKTREAHELRDESFKRKIVEEVVVTVVESLVGQPHSIPITPKAVRRLVGERIDWRILDIIQRGAYGEQTLLRRFERFLNWFAF